MNKRILSFGAGTMAQSLLIPLYQNKEVSFQAYTPGFASALKLATKLNGTPLKNLDQNSLSSQDLYFLCCKPSQWRALASSISGCLNPDAPLVSILAGVSLSTLAQGLNHSKIIRLMPNTPACIQSGIFLFLASQSVPLAQVKELGDALKDFGLVFYAKDENQLDALTAYTGSGPAYLFEIANILSNGLIQLGISPTEASGLIKQLFWGSSKLLKVSNLSPVDLRNQVTSPGGVTEAALDIFHQGNLKDLFNKALEGNYQKALKIRKEHNS